VVVEPLLLGRATFSQSENKGLLPADQAGVVLNTRVTPTGYSLKKRSIGRARSLM
jgi:hypothetical protein